MKTAIISNDAGGAECLSAYLNSIPNKKKIYYLSGPAIKIFRKQKLVKNDFKYSIDDWDSDISNIITSISWENDDWKIAIKKAKKYNVHSSVYIDSWCDYRIFFDYPKKNWESNLPDQLIFRDELSMSIAENLNLHRKCNLKLTKNYFVDYNKKNFEYKKNNLRNLLFLSPPITRAKLNGHKGFLNTEVTQKEILLDIISICKKLEIKLFLRPHPSENRSNILDEYGQLLSNTVISNCEKTIFEDMKTKSLVIGIASSVLVYASLLGLMSISYEKKDLNNIFGWDEFGVYKYFGIKKIDSYNALFRKINNLVKNINV